MSPDVLGQLQSKILELSERMFNSLGVVQRDAPPVRFGDGSQAPLSLGGDSTSLERWQSAVAMQHEGRREFSKGLVETCKSIDLLASSLPPLAHPDPGNLKRLQNELDEAERELQESLDRANGVLKRLRVEQQAHLKQAIERNN